MEDFLRNLQSNDNAVRRAAEQQFNVGLSKDIRSTMNQLLQTVLVSADPKMCEAGAVLFRSQLSRKKIGEEWWDTLSAQERADLRSALLNRLMHSPSHKVSRQLSQIIGQVAGMSFENAVDQWPNLLNDLAQLCTNENNKNDALSAVAISTIGELIFCAPGKIEVGDTPFHLRDLFCQQIANQNASNAVRIAAVGAMPGLIALALEDDEPKFASAIQAMVAALPLIANDEANLLKWFESMIEAINQAPKLIETSGQVGPLVEYMVKISSNDNGSKDFSDDVRKQSLEVCAQMALNCPRLMKEDENIIRALCQVSILLMLDPSDDENDLDELLLDTADGAAAEDDLLEAGARALYAFCECFGEKRILPILFPMIDELLSQNDWRKQRAGLMSLLRASFSGGTLMYDHLGDILQRMLPYVTNEATTPKVRLVALDALSYLFIQFANPEEFFNEHDIYDEVDFDETRPNIQTMYKEPLLEALKNVLEVPNSNDAVQWMIRAKAATTVAHFCGGCEEGNGEVLIGPIVRPLLEKLHDMVKLSGVIHQQQQSHQHSGQQRGHGHPIPVDVVEVQSAALNAVGAIAAALGRGFCDYYPTFMPIAKDVYLLQEHYVQTSKQQQEQQPKKSKWNEKQIRLRGVAMECMANMGTAVGAEVFKADAGSLMEMIMQYMDNAWDQGDSDRNQQVAELAVNICITMDESVDENLLGRLIPKFLAWAKIESFYVPSQEEIDRLEDPDNEDDEEDEQEKQYIMMEEGMICFNSYRMKEKESVMRIIQEMVSSLGRKLMPWAGDIANLVIKELVSDTITTPDLQLFSALIAGSLVESVTKFLLLQKEPVNQQQQEFAQKLFEETLVACIQALINGFQEAKEEDEERLEEMQMGKEMDEDEDQAALVLTTLANQVEIILRASFESGGRSDTDVDLFLQEGYNPDNHPPVFYVPVNKIDEMMKLLMEAITLSCDRPRGHCWWKAAHNHEVVDSLCDGAVLLLKTHRHIALEAFGNHVLPLAFKLLDAEISKKGNGVTGPLKAVGLYFVVDAVEFGGEGALPLIPRIMPYLLKYANSNLAIVRQSAVYGLGMCAELGKDFFNPFLEQSLAELAKLLSAKDAKKKQNRYATDNAVSALHKCILFRSANQAIPMFLSALPCTTDPVECRIIYYRLSQSIANNHPQFMPHLDQIKQIFVKVYNDQTGYQKDKGEFDENDSILSKRTREWVRQTFMQ